MAISTISLMDSFLFPDTNVYHTSSTQSNYGWETDRFFCVQSCIAMGKDNKRERGEGETQRNLFRPQYINKRAIEKTDRSSRAGNFYAKWRKKKNNGAQYTMDVLLILIDNQFDSLFLNCCVFRTCRSPWGSSRIQDRSLQHRAPSIVI